ncbi:chemotaxis protein CheW [Rhodocyclus tenuis]|uniref:Chemotaxis signal transduction protein n=1 Tax=Rhodocyclus tenuis TaxID=1066 RepID=A0A840G7I5_RHOTE|nr:chemotaxis protein CheW [Rhodocyclus tenuis]MBB4247836.1 chemotaxis signal transduction protein [Rhodocyclus tenuis]
MARYKNIELDDRLNGVVRHMNAVEEYRELLQSLQAQWDNLTLLGQLSGTSTDMSDTRQAFAQLTTSLVNHLALETLDKSVQEMTAKAQVAIDILVRNLFERTADIGFLATDDDLRQFVGEHKALSGNIHSQKQLQTQRNRLRERFSEYVAKYSVYSDIILMDTEGEVLARLDESVSVPRSSHPLVGEAIATAAAYVETYAAVDLLPQRERSLVYSYRVTNAAGEAIGVLCLCFRFENEMARIFGNLTTADDWSVVLLLDAQGEVIASSDGFHIPLGAKVLLAIDDDYRIVRFGAQEYLAKTRPSNGYQGYLGPGWYGHVMLPVQHAFNKDSSEMLHGIDAATLASVMKSPSLFREELRNIPLQAEHIQSNLNRSVWNGSVRQSSTKQSLNPSFSKTLLWEISNTGAKTKDVFERSIANLNETVVSALLRESCFLASLAIDIMDRNLYERANDCRWWALTSSFRELLAQPEMTPDKAARIGSILQTINGLYTVYSNLAVFDTQGRVLAVSQPGEAAWVGRTIPANWVRQTLTLENSQGYAVSPFAATPLYADRHTYVYAAAIQAPEANRVVGGIAIVFDAAPQLTAMLRDALPKNEHGEVPSGCFAVFVERSGQIIACSDDSYQPGQRLPFDEGFLGLKNGASKAGVIRMGNEYFAVGARMSSGYREYKAAQETYQNDVAALIFVPLCEAMAKSTQAGVPRLGIRSDRASAGETVEIATFNVGQSWFGLNSAQVVEAMDNNGMTCVPGAGSNFAGYLMYRGTPIPVYDIRYLANAGGARAGTQHQVIVLKRGEGNHFGILADGLGEIPEVALSRLRPLPGMLAGGNVLAEAIISTETPEKEQLLLVLGAERIAMRLAVASGDSPKPATTPQQSPRLIAAPSA